jgi:hypothetical protein
MHSILQRKDWLLILSVMDFRVCELVQILSREGNQWGTYFSHWAANLLPSIALPSNFLLIYGEIIREPKVEKTVLISKSRGEPQSGRRWTVKILTFIGWVFHTNIGATLYEINTSLIPRLF